MTEVLITFGITLENVLLPLLYVILPFMSFNIPIAFMFAVTLSMGRISADGEYAGMLAAGYSLRRIARPILLISIILYGVGLACSLHLEGWGRRELVRFLYKKTQTEVDNILKFKLQSGVFLDDFLGLVLYTEKISANRQNLENVMIAPGRRGKDGFMLLAPAGKISGSVESGDLRLSLDRGAMYTPTGDDGTATVVKFQRAEFDLLRMFREQIVGGELIEDDYRAYNTSELNAFVDKMRDNPARNETIYLRARFLLHQRLTTPFAVITFALFGLVLGVNDPRRSKNAAYIGMIGAIIGGYVVVMAFKWLAERGSISAPLGAWIPNILLTLAGIFLLFQKNRLPPSEGTLDPHNIPVLSRYWRKKVRVLP